MNSLDEERTLVERVSFYRVRTLAFVVVVLSASTARADEDLNIENAQSMTLDDLFKVAVRAAPELQAAAFDAGVAQAKLVAARGVEDWTATLATSESRTKRPASTDRAFSSSLNLTRLLPTNGTVTIAATNTSTEHKEPRASNKFTILGLSVALTQPVLANAGPAVQKAQIRSAAHAATAATIRRSAIARDFVAAVVEDYWQLALSWRRLAVHRRSLEAANKQYATIQRGLTTGAIAKSEAIPFEQVIASRKIDILNDERDIIVRSIDLRLLVGLEVPENPVIKPLELPAPPTPTLEVGKLIAESAIISDELKAAVEDVRTADATLDATRRNKLPSLDLSVSGEISGLHNSLTNAFAEIRDTPGYQVTVGATFAIPIGRRAATGNYRAARAVAARARFDLMTQRRAVTAEVVRLSTEVRANSLTVKLSGEVVKLARQNVEAEIKKFELGKSTSNDIVLRQLDLDNASLRVEEANAAATISQVKLEALTGQILTHYGIRMIDVGRVTSDAFTSAR